MDTSPPLIRSSVARRAPLVAQLVPLVRGDVQRARELALDLETAGRLAAVKWQRRTAPQTDEERKYWRDQDLRLALVDEAFQRNRRKLGGDTAALRAARHWDRRLTYADRRKRLPPPPPLLWENMVGDALIAALEDGLGRAVHPPRIVRGRPPRAGGNYRADLEALAAAFDLIVAVSPHPRLNRGATRRSGTVHWFASRLTTVRKRNQPPLPLKRT